METRSATSLRHHAILIGIDDYPGETHKLKSAVADVRKAEALLLKELQDGVAIHTLAAPLTRKQTPAASVSEGVDPTLHRIVFVFDLVTSQAQAGDYVYIHFSGHGRYKPARDANSEDDVAFILLDETTHDAVQELEGRELAGMIKLMVDKGVLVTLILDCCFSGSVFRSDSEIRCMPDSAGKTLVSEAAQRAIRNRDASMRPNWLLNPEGYTILTACGSLEQTVGLQFHINGQKENFGPLSYYLLETVSYVGLTRSMRMIYDRVRVKLKKDPKTRGQNPVLYGNKEQAFFGKNELPGITRSIPVVGLSDGRIQLQAGRAHGISHDDIFALCSPKTLLSNSIALEDCSKARVVQTGGLTSTLKLIDDLEERVRTGWLAIIVSQAGLGQHAISIGSHIPESQQIRENLTARGLRILTSDEDEHEIELTTGKEAQCVIHDHAGALLLDLSGERLSSARTCDIIEHLMRYRMTEALHNQLGYSDYLTNVSVEFCNAGQTYSDAEEIVVPHNSILDLVIRNSNDKPVYAFPFNLGSFWEAEQLWAGTYCTIYPNGRISKKMQFSVPERLKDVGISTCRDTIKILLTTTPTSFDILELPRWDDCLPINTRTKTKRTHTDGLELWTSFNFRLLVQGRESSELDDLAAG